MLNRSVCTTLSLIGSWKHNKLAKVYKIINTQMDKEKIKAKKKEKKNTYSFVSHFA